MAEMNALQREFMKYVYSRRIGADANSNFLDQSTDISGRNGERNRLAEDAEDHNWISDNERDLRCYPEWVFEEKKDETPLDADGEDFVKENEMKKGKTWQPQELFSTELPNFPRAKKPEALRETDHNPPGPYPFNAASYNQFLDKFKEMPKAKSFIYNSLWEYPKGKEWVCRMVNLETYYHAYEVDTLEFEWVDPAFQEKHSVSQQYLNQIYPLVRGVPDCKFQWKNEEKAYKVGVADLGFEGFHRCVFFDDADRDPDDPLDNDIYIRLVDMNKPMIVCLSCIYQCPQDFTEYPAKCNDFFLNQFASVYKLDCFRQQVYQYFKMGGRKTMYKAVVRFWNKNGIPIVDLYTLDNPPAYVNDLIAADVIKALPGQILPKSPLGICDVFVPFRKDTGKIGLQIQTLESQWFTDVSTEVPPSEIVRMILEYQKQARPHLDKDTIYYTVYYDDQWFYRVKLLTLQPKDPNISNKYKLDAGKGVKYAHTFGMLLANFIDYGNNDMVEPSMLIPAGCIHPALAHFKPQALLARLTPFSKTLRLDQNASWACMDADRNVTVEVLSDGEKDQLPVVDIIVVVRDRPELRLSEILLNPSPREELDFEDDFKLALKLKSQSPYDRRPSALDSLEVIDMKQLCWTRPPQPTVMLQRGVNVLVTITRAIGPNEFTIRPANLTQLPDAWDRMEQELMHWRLLLEDLHDAEYDYIEQRFYCCRHPVFGRYVRVMYIEKERKETFSFPSFRPKKDLDTVRVYAVDYGNYFDISKRQLKMIGRQYCDLPPKAVGASIIQTGKWTGPQKMRFTKAVLDKTFCFRIRGVDYQEDSGIAKITGELYQASAFEPTIFRETFDEIHHDPPRLNLRLTMEELGLTAHEESPPQPGPSRKQGAAAAPAPAQRGNRNPKRRGNPRRCWEPTK